MSIMELAIAAIFLVIIPGVMYWAVCMYEYPDNKGNDKNAG